MKESPSVSLGDLAGEMDMGGGSALTLGGRREVGSVEKRHEACFSHPKEFTLENLDICVLLTAPLILETAQSTAAALVPEIKKK